MDLLARTLSAAEARARDGERGDLRARGVVPTPSALARHGIARVDTLLREELAIEGGLASEQVLVVDPAVGTGVWLAALLEHTRVLGARGTLLGFDSDRDALATVDTLLRAEAEGQGATLTLSCTNTLELATPFGADPRVRVILGNPPWAARSLARGGPLSDAWLEEFRRDHLGAPLRERRVGVLSDDYVRFFRWGLEHARQAPRGAVLCFASNASFLDGPVHRGMRAALLAGFDKLELLDLGGNALLSRDSDGVRDDNVFGVRVGAALTWAVRKPAPERAPASGDVRASTAVRFVQLRGSLRDKLQALALDTSSLPPPVQHTPSAPWFRFRPDAPGPRADGFSIADAFVFQREGVQTNRDALAIAGTQAELEARVRDLAHGKLTLVASRHFDPGHARRVLAEALERGETCVAKLSYRPLDDRFFVTLAPLCHRPRGPLQQAVAHSPLSLLAVRKDRGAAAFNLFGATRFVADACYLSTRSSCRTRVFPSHGPAGADNLSPRIGEALAQRVGQPVTAAQLIAYALSVLGSPRHRGAQQSALQLDYAQLPWPRDAGHWQRALQVGACFVNALDLTYRAPAVCALAGGAAVRLLQPLEALRYDVATRTVTCADGVLLSDIAPRWWSVQVGHHTLVPAVARRAGATLGQLAETLARAALWVEAEAAADALAHDYQR